MRHNTEKAWDPSYSAEQADWYLKFAESIACALEACTRERCEAVGGDPDDKEMPRNVRSAVMAVMESERMQANDFSPVHGAFSRQALALDEIFTQFATMAAKNVYAYQPFMQLALKAQSQCRWTLKALLAMNHAPSLRVGTSRGYGITTEAGDESGQGVSEQAISPPANGAASEAGDDAARKDSEQTIATGNIPG